MESHSMGLHSGTYEPQRIVDKVELLYQLRYFGFLSTHWYTVSLYKTAEQKSYFSFRALFIIPQKQLSYKNVAKYSPLQLLYTHFSINLMFNKNAPKINLL
jgi:hypothetical protein